jgi:uncharacterized protein YggE
VFITETDTSPEEHLMRRSRFPLALLLVSAALAAAAPAIAQMNESPTLAINKENRTITISASDHAEADAEVAELSVGYTVYGATLQAAYKAASESSNAIVEAMLGAGATKSEMQSRAQQVSRLNDYEQKALKGAKFRVSQTWTVSTEPGKAALVLDAAVQAGANQSGDITWRMKNNLALDEEALRKATEHARALAATMAESLGTTLGRPLYATNNVTQTVIRPMYAVRAMTSQVEANAPAPLAISPERVQSNATVQIVFSLEQPF